MSDSLRKAALLIHGLSPLDKRWMLQRIPLDAREQIEPLLSELKELGIVTGECLESDQIEFAASLLAGTQIEVGDHESGKFDAIVSRISKCSHETIGRWAQEEADWVIAQIILIRSWPWAQALVKGLPTHRQLRIQSLSKKISRIPQHMMRMLICQLDEQLQLIARDKAVRASEVDLWTTRPTRESKKGLLRWLQ